MIGLKTNEEDFYLLPEVVRRLDLDDCDRRTVASRLAKADYPPLKLPFGIGLTGSDVEAIASRAEVLGISADRMLRRLAKKKGKHHE